MNNTVNNLKLKPMLDSTGVIDSQKNNINEWWNTSLY